MKKIFISFIFLVCMLPCLRADDFQIYFQEGNGFNLVSYVAIKLLDGRNNAVLFSGYTDKFGRVSINIRPGSYTGKMSIRNKWYSFQLTIDNSRGVKKLYVRPLVQPVIRRP
jgi:hypothetical protein